MRWMSGTFMVYHIVVKAIWPVNAKAFWQEVSVNLAFRSIRQCSFPQSQNGKVLGMTTDHTFATGAVHT